jgi:hypothetical protein
VHADAGRELDTLLRRELPEGPVVGQGVAHGVGGAVEEEQEAVGLVDLPAAALDHQIPGEALVVGGDLGSAPVADGGEEPGTAHEVGDHEGLDGGHDAVGGIGEAGDRRAHRARQTSGTSKPIDI